MNLVTQNKTIITNQLKIDLDAIEANALALRNYLPENVNIMAILKANGYGTDAVEMARCLQNCGIHLFGLNYVHEAVVLREKVGKLDLFALNALPEERGDAILYDIEVGVSSMEEAMLFAKEAEKAKKIGKLHLHIDTGMNRLGSQVHQATKIAQYIHSHPSLELRGVMTHLVASENPEFDPFSYRQIQAFESIVSKIKEKGISFRYTHIMNTSGSLRFQFSSFNTARIGLFFYGDAGVKNPPLPLIPALTLNSKIVEIHTCNRGDSVSYGRKFKVTKDNTRIGVIPLGYHDGIHRSYSNLGEVLVKGKRVKMVGSVCMDFFMVDLTPVPEAKVGDQVTIFGIDEKGNEITIDEFASFGGTISHELIACIGPRVHRRFIRNSQN